MPFKSQAQRRKFAELLVAGKISNKTFEEWNRETGGKTAGACEVEEPAKAKEEIGSGNPHQLSATTFDD